MNTPVWVAWFLVALLAAISILLLMGKGSFLIAGYNMLSKQEKQKYSEKRLCRVAGGGVSIITFMIGIGTAYRFEMPPAISWIIPWGIFGVVAIVSVLANTVCKAKK